MSRPRGEVGPKRVIPEVGIPMIMQTITKRMADINPGANTLQLRSIHVTIPAFAIANGMVPQSNNQKNFENFVSVVSAAKCCLGCLHAQAPSVGADGCSTRGRV